ncbi:flagellar motility protein MotE (MotC chaperone) [Constrictibacter sp. MBR-5]|jgi:flagellar motility protein MotE (MotC chaperone)|uniref:MotE family protein n=1 Tax=Constrictibacter sp. MBR-5 TaxID=3156467 RepID=UPI00339B583F
MNAKSFLPRVGLLPVTLLVAASVFSLKVSDVWQGMSDLRAPVQVAAAVAAEPQAEKPQAPAAPKADAEPAPPKDPALLTQTEIDLLQKLSARREAIEKRERELDMRETLAKAAEARLVAKAAELDQVQKRIEDLMKQHDEKQAEKLDSLVSIYEKMKPADAARILEGLEMDILIDVLSRMKVLRSSPILASMDPAKAREVTAKLAEREQPLQAGG